MELTMNIQQMNQEDALQGKFSTDLTDILQRCTKDRLASIARNHNITGRSKMNKQDLVNALADILQDPERLELLWIISTMEEGQLLERLMGQSSFETDKLYPSDYRFLMDMGIIYSFYDRDVNSIRYVLPEEIQVKYREIQTTAFQLLRERHLLLLQYTCAVVNLYGACEPEQLQHIFNAHNQEKLNPGELQAFLTLHLSRDQEFELHEQYIVHLQFIEDATELDELLNKRQGKPFYVPSKPELLQYADEDYFEMTPQLFRLKKFISDNLSQDTQQVEGLIDDIQFCFLMEEPLQHAMHEFERRQLYARNQVELNQLMMLMIDVANHTRIWSNGGHTPTELNPTLDRALGAPMVVNEQQAVTAVKVGRNDTCPCLSGKKFKRCCGK